MTMTSPRPLAQSSYFLPAHPDEPGTRPLDIMPDPPTHLSDPEEYTNDGGEHPQCPFARSTLISMM